MKDKENFFDNIRIVSKLFGIGKANEKFATK